MYSGGMDADQVLYRKSSGYRWVWLLVLALAGWLAYLDANDGPEYDNGTYPMEQVGP